jgi:hypothetical protein
MRTITVTATDSDGAMTSAVRHVVVDPTPPTATIDAPTSSSSVFAGTMVTLSASGASGSYPLTDICTLSGFTFRWSSNVATDAIANPAACGSTTAVFMDTTQPHILSYEIDDPWGEHAYASVQFNVVQPPPNTFSAVTFTMPTANESFTMGPINEAITTTPAAVAPATYTWTATSYAPDVMTMTPIVFATTNISSGAMPSVSWDPSTVSGFVNQTAAGAGMGELIRVEVHVTDANGMSGDGYQYIRWVIIPP